jgi:hypothetical protein
MQCVREKTNVGPSEFKRKGAQEAQERRGVEGGAKRNHIINGWRHMSTSLQCTNTTIVTLANMLQTQARHKLAHLVHSETHN